MNSKLLLLFVCLSFLGIKSAIAQINGRIATLNVNATATVTDNLQMLTIRNIDLINPGSQNSQIIVSPTTSSFAGMFKILGNPKARVRITYLQNEILKEVTGGRGLVQAKYDISGALSDTQFQSTPLTVGEANILLSEQGEYFIWLGATLDISQAIPGIYLSEFIIELEYI